MGKSLVNQISIKLKITIGFVIFFALFILQFLFSARAINRIDDRVNSLASFSETTSIVLQVNKDISEIQRLVLAFGQTGGSGIYENLEARFKTMEKSIDLLQAELKNEELAGLVKELVLVSSHYGKNIPSLRTLFKSKELYTNELPMEIYNKGEVLLSKHIKTKHEKEHASGLWSGAFFHAMRFFVHKDYNSKKEAILRARDLRNHLSSLKVYNEEIRSVVRDFEDTFEKGTISNRNYSALVNVVMSGDATEFTSVAGKLKDLMLRILEAKKKESQDEIGDSYRQILISLLFFIPIIIGMIFFYNNNISKVLKEITSTFNEFLSNDFQHEVPGLNRSDEIGVLAKAADNFKSLSFRFQIEKEKAENLARIKSDFLANMSHEIRTPMNGMLGMVSHIKETPVTEEQSSMLDTITSCGDSLLTILNDILDLSKAESGKLELEDRPINLFKLLDELKFLFQMKAKEKGLDFNCQFVPEDKIEFVKGDVTRIKQILINLISNAIKFTEKGEVSLSVETTLQEQGQVTLQFSVRDTGIGISEENLELIFNAFSQSDSSTTRRFGGTGLGLSISQKLATLMNSEIFVDSHIGEGSLFTLSLKLKVPSENEIIEFNRDTSVVEFITAFDAHCLVVEDNEINIKVLTKRLDKLGITYDIALNGQEAIEITDYKKHDCILMDLQMPVLDGLSASRELRKRGYTKPIIAMTANVQQSDKDACASAGMDDFVGKPIKKDELIAVFTRRLNKMVS
ncbi:MAG: response regulator [Bacteriovoracaceae bacterium]|nr:response regulator [Bacteriovoracaceae bacterium]